MDNKGFFGWLGFAGFLLFGLVVWGFFCRVFTCFVGYVVRFPEELQTWCKSKADDQYKECKGTSQIPPGVPALLCSPAVKLKRLFR